MLAASPGFFWAMAEIGKVTRASKKKRFFITDWTRGEGAGFKEKSFRHRPIRRDKPLVATDERRHVAIAHPPRRIRREHRAIPAATVHDDLGLVFGNRFFQVAFENAFPKVNGLRGAASQPFA